MLPKVLKEKEKAITAQKKPFWKRCLDVFRKKQGVKHENPLEKIDASSLKMEDLSLNQNASFLEIAIMNANGDLEIVHLPQEVFTVRVENEKDPTTSREETVVILELKDISNEKQEQKADDPHTKITHFPPNHRLH